MVVASSESPPNDEESRIWWGRHPMLRLVTSPRSERCRGDRLGHGPGGRAACARWCAGLAVVDVFSAAGRMRLLAAGADDPGFVGQDDRLDPVAHVELVEHAGDVRLDREWREKELLGDLWIGDQKKEG